MISTRKELKTKLKLQEKILLGEIGKVLNKLIIIECKILLLSNAKLA